MLRRAKKAKNVLFLKTFNWFLLSFLAGCINVGGFLACQRFVTHVTGFATLFGSEIAYHNWDRGIGILSVPAFFLLGVMISAYLVDRRYHIGRRPHYATVMALITVCLVLSAWAGILGWFGGFGEPISLKRDYVLLALLCMASGLMNACVTTSSGSQVRITHLTGVTTDLGLGLVRAYYSRSPQEYRAKMYQNWLRIGSIASFVFGSVVGAIVFNNFEFTGFLFPALISLIEVGIAWRYKVLFFSKQSFQPQVRLAQIRTSYPSSTS